MVYPIGMTYLSCGFLEKHFEISINHLLGALFGNLVKKSLDVLNHIEIFGFTYVLCYLKSLWKMDKNVVYVLNLLKVYVQPFCVLKALF